MGNLTLKELGRRAFETAKAKGFHDEPIDIPRALMLTVSELAEALEADRKNKRADLSAFFDKEPCEIFPFREKFEVHVKDTFEKAQTRMGEAWRAGFMPMAMLFRDLEGKYSTDWRRFQRQWANPTITICNCIKHFGR